MHGADELTSVALVAVTAALIGLGLVRVKQPAIVGYILTGVLLGPSIFGIVTDRDAIALLAELGVILLLYFIGMELSLRSFRLIWKSAVLVALAQIFLGLVAMVPPAFLFDWSLSWLILGAFCLALSSTAVAFNILEDADVKKSRAGRMAIGILIAQDLAVAPMLLIIDGLKNFNQNAAGAAEAGNFQADILTIAFQLLLTIGILILLIVYLSRKKRVEFVWLSHAVDRTDLLPLVALASCFGVAFLAGSIGLSPAFGAFMAGLVVGNSSHREVMRRSAEPVQVVLLMIFFLSVGLLLDVGFVWDNLWIILISWVLVTIFKTFSNLILARLTGLSWLDGLSVALVIAQMGEFSFVLAATAYGAGVIDADIHRFIVALTVLSLIISPIYVQLVRRNRHHAMRHIDGLKDVLDVIFSREYKFSQMVTRKAFSGSKTVLESSMRAVQVRDQPIGYKPEKSEAGEDDIKTHNAPNIEEKELIEEKALAALMAEDISEEADDFNEDQPLSEEPVVQIIRETTLEEENQEALQEQPPKDKIIKT